MENISGSDEAAEFTADSPEFHPSAALIDHIKNPRNMDDVPDHNGFAVNDGYCGDMMMMWVKIENEVVVNATFMTDGCGPSIACGSAATEIAKGKTIDEAREIFPENIITVLGGLPEDHVHCASLAAGTLQLAITDYLENNS
jgi:nitrogen fixation NifU-like protein